LGEGGFGSVHLAEDNIGRQVALKVLHPQVADDEMLSGYFKREAVALGRLSHANIVQIHSFEQAADKTFIVMEYVDGPTLSAILKTRDLLPLDDTLAIFVQVLRALGHAHAKGVIHRDIKPGNIMLTQDGKVKIADFGIARVTGTEKLTKTGTGAGSLLYMSPEQIKGKGIDQRSDIYSLGATLFQMLTGSTPFQGDSDYDIMTKQLNVPAPPLREFRGDLSPALEAVVLRALAKRKEDRFQSAEEMATALETLRTAGEVLLETEALSEKTRVTISDIYLTDETVIASTPRQGGSKKGMFYGLAGIALVVIVAIAYIFWPSGEGEIAEPGIVQADTNQTDVEVATFSDSLAALRQAFEAGSFAVTISKGGVLLKSGSATSEHKKQVLQLIAASRLLSGDKNGAEADFARLKQDYQSVSFPASEYPAEVVTAWSAINNAPIQALTIAVTVEKWDLFDRLMVELDGTNKRYSGSALQFEVQDPNRVYDLRLVSETEMYTDTVKVGNADRSKTVRLEAIASTVRVVAKDVDDRTAIIPAEVFVDGKKVTNQDGTPRNTPCNIDLAQGPHKVWVEFEGYRNATGSQYLQVSEEGKLEFMLKAR
jgi:hypothetical protein